MDILFVNIGALRVKTLVFKGQICLHLQTRALMFWSEQILEARLQLSDLERSDKKMLAKELFDDVESALILKGVLSLINIMFKLYKLSTLR